MGQEKMKGLLIRNIGIKISAFLVALIVWFYFFAAREGISFTAGRTRALVIPVEVLERPSSLFTVNVAPNYVEVLLKGPNELVANLDAEEVKVFVEVKGLGKGRYTLPVKIRAIERVTVVSREPQVVTVLITGGF